MATTSCFSPTSSFLLSLPNTETSNCSNSKGFVSFSLPPSIHIQFPKLSCFSISHSCSTSSSSLHLAVDRATVSPVLAVVNEELVVGDENAIDCDDDIEGQDGNNEDVSLQNSKIKARPCEMYVCNLPRSFDISDLLEMFKPFGTVLSVEVSRNPDTGVSRGCGYVTMSAINQAKNAIAALDGSDVGGRELRVRFSVDMNSRSRNPAVLNSAPKKNLMYESPHKVYVGNLPWRTKPEDLRNHFSQFGTVLSTRVLHDRKAGKNRVFGFLSFSSAEELVAALSLDGTNFDGRTLVVKEGIERTET